mmetsp:Transcript_103709/g.183976  ORF Transcript_103709/g.183976 Transcript_103709/m.183976 type:complete len:212 (-) Transcript_103709:331-966(-)
MLPPLTALMPTTALSTSVLVPVPVPTSSSDLILVTVSVTFSVTVLHSVALTFVRRTCAVPVAIPTSIVACASAAIHMTIPSSLLCTFLPSTALASIVDLLTIHISLAVPLRITIMAILRFELFCTVQWHLLALLCEPPSPVLAHLHDGLRGGIQEGGEQLDYVLTRRTCRTPSPSWKRALQSSERIHGVTAASHQFQHLREFAPLRTSNIH